MLNNLPKLDEFDVLVFDMDGLLLNSLDNLSSALTGCVKIDMDDSTFAKFLEYDRMNPGKSRYEKFKYAYQTLLVSENYKEKIDFALGKFEEKSLTARIQSELDDAIFTLFELHRSKKFILLSNCANNQINRVVLHHELESIFQDNVFGTPPTKLETLTALFQENPGCRFISISDSESDAEAAESLGIDFLYIHRFARGNMEWIKEGYFTSPSLSALS